MEPALLNQLLTFSQAWQLDKTTLYLKRGMSSKNEIQ
jgi:hypothetical protein